MPKEKPKRRLQPVRSAHIDDIIKRLGAIPIQTDRRIEPRSMPMREKGRKYQQMSAVMPFSLAADSLPPSLAPMTAAAMSAEAAEAAASQRDFEELLGMGPNDFGNETKPADDTDLLITKLSNTSLKDRNSGSLGGYRKNKSRRHKTRRHNLEDIRLDAIKLEDINLDDSKYIYSLNKHTYLFYNII